MQEQSNQLPPEFDHLRDSEFPEVIIPESHDRTDSENSPRRAIRSTLGTTYAKALLGLAGVVFIALIAKQLIQTKKPSVTEHYQALEQLDSDTKTVVPQQNELTGPGDKPIEAQGSAETPADATKPSIQQYEMAQADIKADAVTELKQPDASSLEERVNQRLGLVETAIQKLLAANEGHAQSIELLRNEQAQLMLKMQSNDNALADMRGKIESLQTRVTQPKPVSTNTVAATPKQVGSALPTPKQREPGKTGNITTTTQVPKTLELAPALPVPTKPRAQLPEGLRLVSLKNLNGKNTAVIRIGGAFSPMLFEGQSWNGIQILNARVHERAAQVMYQGDEFGLVL